MTSNQQWVKPVIILVPGAWNSPGSFNLLIPHLESAGYRARGIELASVGADPPIDDIQPDVKAIRTAIQHELDNGQDVLLLMHDYASVPGGEAVKGLDKASRSHNGLDGGVTCLFYAASPLLPAGLCMADLFPEEDDSWVKISRNNKVAIPEKPIEVFCPEVEPELAKEYIDSLRPHSFQTFLSKTTWEPYREIPFYCLFCKLDVLIPIEKQKSLASKAAHNFKSTTVNAGHCPFLTTPEEMAKAIRRAAKESTYYSGIITKDYGFRANPRS